MKTGFIGAGKAGCSVSRYLQGSRIQISGYYSKTRTHSQQAADDTKSVVFLSLEEVVSNSDMIFVTTPDSAISQVWEHIKKLEDQGRLRLEGKVMCHLSGSLSSQVFEGIRRRGAFACAAHPMLAISSRDTDLTGAFFTLDGDEEGVRAVKTALESRGNPTAVIQPSCKKKYHMAAACASNLAVGLVQMAVDSLTECGFTPGDGLRMLTPLMMGNMKNICEKGPDQALTGPVERGDEDTIRAHLLELTGAKKDIYRLLSLQLINIAQNKNQNRDYTAIKTILEEKDQ